MASAIISPISVSPFAETVPTWAISSLLVTFGLAPVSWRGDGLGSGYMI
jgi:hypothetical protein